MVRELVSMSVLGVRYGPRVKGKAYFSGRGYSVGRKWRKKERQITKSNLE